MSGLVAVHVGAGYHATSLRPFYKKTCKDACEAGVQMLKTGCNAVEAVTAAVIELENCPLTNAGCGSNINLSGNIECDAGIMDGYSLNYASVGALPNIKNPINVAKRILEEQSKGLLPFGRIPPSTLVGSGAVEWASEHGFEVVENSSLSTKTSRAVYLKNMSLLQSCNNISECDTNFLLNDLEGKSCNESSLLDTVGAVCVDSNGNMASAVSSGGLLLKHSGRIGQAAVYGSGCWAQNSVDIDKPGIACSVTGVGEYLIKTTFAKECYRTLYDNSDSISALPNAFRKHFLNSPFLKNVSPKLAGILTAKYYSQGNYCELAWAHTTRTMILGFMGTSDKNPSAVVSVQPHGALCGESIVGSEKCIKLSSGV